MNILYLTQIFSSSRGGAPLLIFDLANAMSRRGHNVHIICNLSTENIDEHNLVIHVIKPYLKASHQLPPSITQNLRYIVNSIVYGLRTVKENRIDVVHTNSWTPVIAGSIIGRLTGVPVVSTVVDIFTNNEFGGWSRWAKLNKLPRYHAIAGRILEKVSLMMPSDIVHTISKASMYDVKSILPDARIKVIYPGIDTAESITQTHNREYCDFVLFIGRLVYYKNVDVLIKAFKSVINMVPSGRLIIVGEGPMKESWRTMASNAGLSQSVFFLGNISTSEKIKLLSKCSAVALPSVFEGFGLVILEAFAMAKPVLVSDVKPFDEIVDDGIDGFILPKDDPDPWSHRMIYLLLNRNLCKKMGENGLPKAHDKFSLNKSMDQMDHLYRELCLTTKKNSRRKKR